MGELLGYLLTLRSRGLSVAFRELRSRFLRKSSKTATRRLMTLCEEHNAIFTFYITGNTALRNKEFVKEILARGHGIECHGYNHMRFDLESRDIIERDLRTAKTLYEKLFHRKMCGFRAPYLALDDRMPAILQGEGFLFSSSTMGNEWFEHSCGLTEMPISACDWQVLIRDNRAAACLLTEMLDKEKEGAVFELHPWRMGQKKYLWIVEEFLRQKRLKCVSQEEIYKNKSNSIALTGDLGEMGLSELILRTLFRQSTDYEAVIHQLGIPRGR